MTKPTKPIITRESADKGTAARQSMAEFKRSIRRMSFPAGRDYIADLLDAPLDPDQPAYHVHAEDALEAIHRVGPVWVAGALAYAEITAHNARLSDLTPGQRKNLADYLRGANRQRPHWATRLTAVSNAAFRDRFNKLVAADPDAAIGIAHRMDWYERGRADTHRVRRTLGLVETTSHNGRTPVVRHTINHETAVRLADAMNMDLRDAGL